MPKTGDRAVAACGARETLYRRFCRFHEGEKFQIGPPVPWQLSKVWLEGVATFLQPGEFCWLEEVLEGEEICVLNPRARHRAVSQQRVCAGKRFVPRRTLPSYIDEFLCTMCMTFERWVTIALVVTFLGILAIVIAGSFTG